MIWEIIQKYKWILNVFLIACATFIIARLLGNFFIPENRAKINQSSLPVSGMIPTQSKPIPMKNNFDPITKRNIFGAPLEKEINPVVDIDEKEYIPPPTPPLNLQLPAIKSDINAELLGTVVRKNITYSRAILKVADRVHQVKLHDMILNEAKIILIERGRIEFIRNNQKEYLAVRSQLDTAPKQGTKYAHIPKPQPISPKVVVSNPTDKISNKGNNTFEIPSKRFQAALKNLPSILNEAASVPNIVDGKIEGYIIFAIEPGSIFDELKIHDGDKIIAVNGQTVNGLDKVLTMFQTLKTKNHFKILVEHEGKRTTHTYSIK